MRMRGGPKETVHPFQADHYEITFRHVSFHYPGTDENVYTDFSFTIKAGKKLAIVGINGAGKTTLVKLVTRLYDPTEGEILLNGTDIRRFALPGLQKSAGSCISGHQLICHDLPGKYHL